MSTDTTTPQAPIASGFRTTAQLLARAEKDTDAVSVFGDGTSAIFVVKGRENIAYLTGLLERQGLMTPSKGVVEPSHG